MVLSLFAVACASNSSSSTPTAETTGDTAEQTAEPTHTTEPTASAPPTATANAGGSDDAREMTATECKVLGQKQGDLTRSDQTATLSEKLTPAQRKSALESIDKFATQQATKWEEGCLETLVGKMASEQALKCAMAAKTVAAFATCIEGPPK
ncbi:MAG: hypothetical protein HOW73_41410 [Polyangiaceae bacterium]|nr:hypothetical protein [Polyangiaceae bacterium]